MAKLTDILKEIGDESIDLQFLGNSTVNIKDKKRTNDTEITFATSIVDCNSFIDGNKAGIVIWVDKSEYNSAVEKLNQEGEE